MSFVITNTPHEGNCPICVESLKENVLVHDGKCPIHGHCLRDLLAAAIAAQKPPECPLCREEITMVEGKPVEPVQRRRGPAPIDPLSQDAIDRLEIEPQAPIVRMSTNRLVLRALVPGFLENLQRNHRPVGRLVRGLDNTIFDLLGTERNLCYIFSALTLVGIGTTNINDVGYVLTGIGLVTTMAMVTHLHQTIRLYGRNLFPNS